MKTRETGVILALAVFLLGGSLLVAAWAYSGYILPRQPPASSSNYDKGGFYIEIGIWVVTAASAVVLAINLWKRRSSSGR